MNARNVLTIALFFLLPLSAWGQGITDVRPLTGPQPHRWRNRIHSVQVKSHHVQVNIESGVAVTKLTQVFHNPNGAMLEGSYLFPIPDRASITAFTMVMNGKEVRGEVLEKGKARRIYEGIVRSMKDPALLEYVGRDLFKARVFPIPAHGDVQVSLTYVQELKSEGGVSEYRYPLKTQAFSKEAVGSIAVHVKVVEQTPIKSVFSSSHKISKARKSETEVSASFEGKSFLARGDFHLFYTTSKSDVGLHVLSEKDGSEAGHFMMKLTPKVDFKAEELASRDIVFVVDTSGSMQDDNKMEQAKSALIYGLRTLRNGDRFNIVSFSTEARPWRSNMVSVDKLAVAEAVAWVKKIRASGGTNIDEALTTALASFTKSERLPMVVFLTDGVPTVGETNENSILGRAASANGNKARIFVFGLGYDVNARLLDLLADKGKGARDYITSSGNLELSLSRFFDKVAFPVLTDVTISVDGVEVSQVYPKDIPDLFKGSELTLLGSYGKAGNAVIRLKGRLGKQEKTYVFEHRFSDKKAGRDFIAVLWAKRKVGFLWDQIRLKGENNELKKEIVRLGKKYAIATPYTSILVQEDRPFAGTGGNRLDRRQGSRWRQSPGTPGSFRRRGGLAPSSGGTPGGAVVGGGNKQGLQTPPEEE